MNGTVRSLTVYISVSLLTSAFMLHDVVIGTQELSGMPHETKELNRSNNHPQSQVMPSEFLENVLKYNEKSTTAKSKACDPNKNPQLRLSDDEERKWMPLQNWQTRKPFESTKNFDNIKLDYSHLQKLTYVNNSENRNSDQYQELEEFQRLSKILLHELKNNEFVTERKDGNLKFVTGKENASFSDTKKEKTDDKSNVNLPQIIFRKGLNKKNYLDNNKSDSAIVQSIANEEPVYIFNSTMRKSAIGEIKKENNGESISNIDNGDNLQKYTSTSDESEELYDDIYEKNVNGNVSARSNKENDSIEYNDKSSLDLDNIQKELFESKRGMKISDLSNSPLVLMESHRICYSCKSFNDTSCVKPNRQTTVKYCNKHNMACVSKSYAVGGLKFISRDCGSSCVSADKDGLAINYETCSICYSDLCNSAYSINMLTAPLIFFAFLINKIVY